MNESDSGMTKRPDLLDIGQALEPLVGREVEQFDPKRHRLKVAALDYGIEEAKRIKDWPALEDAIDAKIGEQRDFVTWWKGNVSVRHGGPKSRERGTCSLKDAETLTGMANQRVADLRKRLQKPAKYRDQLLGAEYRAAFLAAVENVRGTTGTGENEWFTPVEYIEKAREVLGEIDLDPATHEAAQETVRANHYLTKDDDGLTQEWHGSVWLNPPYAQPLISQFVDKLLEEFAVGRVTAAILLTHNYTDTGWFQKAAGHASALCFTRGRVKFYEPDGAIAAPTQGQAFHYFGDDVDAFYRAFSSVGFVAVSMRE
jgi:phage N-6-adenine-methyltransferase